MLIFAVLRLWAICDTHQKANFKKDQIFIILAVLLRSVLQVVTDFNLAYITLQNCITFRSWNTFITMLLVPYHKTSFFNHRKQSFCKNSLSLPFAWSRKALAPMSAAHCIFFSFWTKDEHISCRTKDRLLNINYLHGLYGWNNDSGLWTYTYRLGLKSIDYCRTDTPLKWLSWWQNPQRQTKKNLLTQI